MGRLFIVVHAVRALAVVLIFAAAGFAQDVARMELLVQSLTPDNRFMGDVLLLAVEASCRARVTGRQISMGHRQHAGDKVSNWLDHETVHRGGHPAARGARTSLGRRRGPQASARRTGRLGEDHRLPPAHTYVRHPELHEFPGGPVDNVGRCYDGEAGRAVSRQAARVRAGRENQRQQQGVRALLGYLIEKISGKTYAQFLQENIFAPLGMTGSGYDSQSAVLARRAAGYGPSPNGPVNAPFLHMTIPHGAGALYSTTEDLLRWNQALFGGKLLSAASLEKMTTPVKNDYGFGIAITTANGLYQVCAQRRNQRLQQLPGVLSGQPRDDSAVLANMNGPAADELGSKLSALAHGESVVLQSERKPITVSPKVLAQDVGTYQVGPGANLVIRLDGDQLTAGSGHRPRLPIFAESETRFFLRAVDAQLDFVKDDKGVVSHAVMHQNGRDTRAARIP